MTDGSGLRELAGVGGVGPVWHFITVALLIWVMDESEDGKCRGTGEGVLHPFPTMAELCSAAGSFGDDSRQMV